MNINITVTKKKIKFTVFGMDDPMVLLHILQQVTTAVAEEIKRARQPGAKRPKTPFLKDDRFSVVPKNDRVAG